MARRIAPTLRGVFSTKSLEPEQASGEVFRPAREVEVKTIQLGGWTSGTTTIYGLQDRAAGWDMETVVTEGYERSIWVFKCVEKIAGDAARLPFRIGRHIGDDDEEVLEDHPLYRVLNVQANPMETGQQFRKRLSAQVLLSKRGAFVEVTRSRMNTITRLDLLPPDRVTPIPDEHGDYIKHFEFCRYDGQIRKIAPERIRWIRNPHPTDPFCGVTPLEAAGISVELDFLARLYNVTFLKNDARPGGVVGVDTDGLQDQELDRIEQRFKPGSQNAGYLAVVGTGPGGLTYIDTSTRPRDMDYGQLSQSTKNEILAAFGVGESLFGNASGRTFDNAEQEKWNYWLETELPHCDIVYSSFGRDVDVDGGWAPFLDTSKVDVLELPRRKRREEARAEVDKGLRTIDEYRPLAGLTPVGNPQTRALWVSPAKAPIPTNPGDAAALGVAGNQQGGPSAPGQGGPGQEGPTAADVVAAASGQAPPVPGQRA
ncbi:MAG TPA: phage portal protein, partial [Kineosporiaceae bacterium]|nr:phage portal protein [Kineosporiaceae bacterium]